MFRKLIKKLNNFRFTAIIAACISGVAAVYGLLSFFLFHYAGDLVPGEKYIRQVGFYDKEINEMPIGGYLSFLVFLGFLGAVICGIIVAYSLVPFIKNKEKLAPKKSVLIVGVVGALFEALLIFLMVLLLLEPEAPNTMIGIIISLPFGILTTIGQLLYLIPYFKCNFYMPEVQNK